MSNPRRLSMNSGRTKYTSTPTFGMQRRGFGKKRTETKPGTELDFTQKPAPDFDAPVSGASDLYAMPQGIYHDPIPRQVPVPYQTAPQQGMNGGFAIPMQNAGMQETYPLYGAGQGNAYGETNQPFTGTPLPQLPPLANTAKAAPYYGGAVRAQGYVPPNAPYAEQPAGLQPNNMGIGYPGQSVPYSQPVFSAQPPFNRQTNGQGAFSGYSGGSVPPGPPAGKKKRQPLDIESVLKMLLYIILPVAFVLSIALPGEFDILRYLFMTACAASVGILWYRQSFSSSLRTGITIGYGLMCVVVIVMLLSGSNSDIIQGGPNITAQPTPVITDEPEANAQSYSADQAPVTVPPAETVPAETDAGLRLTAFMDNWKVNDIENMLGYVMPSWRQSQTDAAAALFIIISNRTPLEYTIESISGSDSDTSRAITMSALIDKNNGNDAVKYRFVILMDKEGNDWFVDPNSLSTNDIDTTEATEVPDNLDAIFTLAPRTTVTPVPPDSTLLYYNANGGKYYHADPECSAVNAKYLPMASFTFGELGNAPYSSLLPCLQCNAPTKAD